MKKQHVNLSDADRNYLRERLSKGQLKAREFKRAMGLLELDRGKTLCEVSKALGVSRITVKSWSTGYHREGLQVLRDKPRSGRPIEISGEQRAKITALACSEAPEGHSRWDLRLLADKAVELGYCDHISHTQVHKILKKTNSNRTSKRAGVLGK